VVGADGGSASGRDPVASGFQECSVADAEKITAWLVAEIACKERAVDLVREALLTECRRQRIEPPTDGRIERMVRSAVHQAEATLCARVHSPTAARRRNAAGSAGHRGR